jgi:hypothetical protein
MDAFLEAMGGRRAGGGLTIDELADRTGKSRGSVERRVRTCIAQEG